MTGFDWGVIVRALPFLWDGMKVSLMLTGAGVLGGVLLGTCSQLCGFRHIAPCRSRPPPM